VGVYAEPEDLQERCGRLELTDPKQDVTGARAKIEVLYMEKVLGEHVDWVQLCVSACRQQ
jgi:hypothetical protein